MSKRFNNFIKNCKKYKKDSFDLLIELLTEQDKNFIKTYFKISNQRLNLDNSNSVVVYSSSLEKSYICWSNSSYKEEDHVMFKKCLSQGLKNKLK